MPARAFPVGQPQRQRPRGEAGASHSVGGLRKENTGAGIGAAEMAPIRRENPPVAEHPTLGLRPSDGVAVQSHPEPLPLDAAPEATHLLGLEAPQGRHVPDPRLREAGRIALGDARDVLQGKGEEARPGRSFG